MTIGIDASRANAVERTGTEWYSVHIIAELLRQHPEALFILYTREPLRPPLTAAMGPNVENRVLHWHGFLWSQIRLSWEMLVRPPDILFVPAHTIPMIHPKATITTCHDVGFERFPELYGHTPIGPKNRLLQLGISVLIRVLSLGRYGNSELDYHRWSLRFAIHHAAHIITISSFSARELVALLKINPAHITTIPLGYTPRTATTISEPTIRNRYSLHRPYLLYVGRLETKKNIVGLLRAYAEFVRQWPEAPDLVLVGKRGVGYEKIAATEQVVPNHPIRLHELPWLPSDEIDALYRAASAFAFPSHYEGFGLPILEAFAHGVPVIASDAGAIPEIAGSAALLVTTNDYEGWVRGLRRITTDTEMRAGLIAAGRTRVAEYQWPETARRTWQVITSVQKTFAPTP